MPAAARLCPQRHYCELILFFTLFFAHLPGPRVVRPSPTTSMEARSILPYGRSSLRPMAVSP